MERIISLGLNGYKRRKESRNDCLVQSGHAEIEGDQLLFIYGNALEVLNNVEFQNPIILQVDPSHKPRTWQNTINSHGDWGRHQSHKEMLDSQSTNEWCTEIPAIPTDALQMAKNLKNQSQESKDSSEAEQLKVRARNLFEIAKMNEIYYATNHPNDQKRMAEIDLNLQSLST